MSKERFGIIQMTSGPEPEENFKFIEHKVEFLSAKGMKWILTPENSLVFGSRDDYHRHAEFLGKGKYQDKLSDLARRHQIHLIIGSFPIRVSETEVTTTTLVFDVNGQRMNHYDKLHMFDVDVNDGHKNYRESETFKAGTSIAMVPTDFGAVGLTICYDLRFPHLFSALRAQGASVIVVPAAFTAVTGKAHWEVLLRARAIENQCWIVAANQCGTHPCGRETWGHSMVISPWGEVQGQLEQQTGTITAELNFDVVEEVRQSMPVAKHIRFEQHLH
ncbi:MULTISPECIES: carbon-nitrogen hydrolase family protein [Vibrio]|jgi:predicted amidohydrolase|uniref:Amidohydrolase n=1 Tax=Vibrio mediterranei TaxID=689 RepID=A0ABX5D5S9_9VIBR|nr:MULTISPECIES: carbon-nitrogen hydrolase family protein [Vibrio]EDL53996.1 putative carbon-nitrogen hydrolase [Vibrio mediterranei AK1]MCG9656113.1 carbon-nitrogen hydrolase family protein [Vibrio mediterranei]MDA0109694.1 carbon-nitrogen hydrolase family protein [Vibrio sp. La 4.2.2]NOH28557.1 carbon-nitrogen hydrolase family protein [Vibrio mediterranei]NUW71251.1 carbon-nitrogen hydrolase family protein [Vibrio mediterranei]